MISSPASPSLNELLSNLEHCWRMSTIYWWDNTIVVFHPSHVYMHPVLQTLFRKAGIQPPSCPLMDRLIITHEPET